MRKLKTEKTVKIDYEKVIKIEIDKITNETNITVASGYLDGQDFIPVAEGERSYKIKDVTEEMSDADYFAEADKQDSQSVTYYGLLYRAKQAGVFIVYSAKNEEAGLSVSVVDTTITVKLEPLVTTNQEIINAINASHDALSLIYLPDAIDLDADVDAPETLQEIK